jgi:hypothetical protein
VPNRSESYWQPRDEFEVAGDDLQDYNSVTLMMITSCHLFYTKESTDPVFPAKWDKEVKAYRNPHAYPSILACVDWNKVCVKGGSCTSVRDERDDRGPVYEFTRLSMLKAVTYRSINTRRGSALQAQELIRGFRSSLPTEGDKQWVVEARGLFNTSLARIQHDARSIAMGEARLAPGTEEDSYYNDGRLKGIYKAVLPRSMSNINILALVCEVLAGVVVIVLDSIRKSWETVVTTNAEAEAESAGALAESTGAVAESPQPPANNSTDDAPPRTTSRASSISERSEASTYRHHGLGIRQESEAWTQELRSRPPQVVTSTHGTTAV